MTAAGVSIASWLRTQAERSLYTANTALTAELAHREHLTRLLLTAQEDERRRIARDLHDGALGDLSATIVALDVLSRRSSPATPDDLRAVQTQVREVAGQVREMMNNLRPTILDDGGLAAALTQLAHKFETRGGVPIQMQIDLPPQLDPLVETVIFRVAQEALANIIQHAGARQIQISLAAQAAGISLEISDDGQGFEPEPARRQAEARGHIGLASLVERVEGVGGQVNLTSAPQQGTRVRCWFPPPSNPPLEQVPALTSTGRG
jgi:two-component system NarL family sensor kinase